MSLLQAVRLQMTSKTANKPVMSFTGRNNTLAHFKQSHGYDQMSHSLSNIHCVYTCTRNLLDIISVYSLDKSKLPRRFSCERPGYEANFVGAVLTLRVMMTLIVWNFPSMDCWSKLILLSCLHVPTPSSSTNILFHARGMLQTSCSY